MNNNKLSFKGYMEFIIPMFFHLLFFMLGVGTLVLIISFPTYSLIFLASIVSLAITFYVCDKVIIPLTLRILMGKQENAHKKTTIKK